MSESVASLLSRLGTPPSDLIDHLTERFQAICEERIQSGHGPITQIDPQDWLVTSEGDLLFNAPEGNQPSKGLGETPPLSAEELTTEFRRLLGGPPQRISENQTLENHDQYSSPSPSSPATSSRVSGPRTAHTRASGQRATNYGPNLDVDGDQKEYSDADRARREKMAEMFTASLTERFGEDIVTAESQTESVPPKYEIIQRDRRFNWNLVMGVVTVAIVAAIAYAGYNVSENRKQRMASSSGYRPAANTGQLSHESATSNNDRAEPAEIDSSEVPPLKDSSASAFQEQDGDRAPPNPLETIENLMTSGDSTANEEVEIQTLEQPVPPVDIEIPTPLPRTLPNQNAAAKAADETLVEALPRPDEPTNIPEAPQEIRRGPSRYVRLPTSTKPGTRLKLAEAGTNLVGLEFPINSSIEFAKKPAGAQLVNTQTEAIVATLSPTNQGVLFEWGDAAIRDSSSKSLLHGRLRPTSGQPIYLRPSIEADPYQLTLSVRDTHPTWNLGAPILPSVTRLDVELDVPNVLEYGWSEPFDATRPSRGSAVAILTPPDGESVALAVQVNVRCDRKLSCNLKYAARLDQSKPWLPITREDLLRAGQGVQQDLAVWENKKKQFSSSYAQAGSTDRRLMRRKGEEIDKAFDITKTTMERLTTLKTLVEAIESSVTLKLHLYVQWNDDQQTILRTSTVSQDAL